MEMSGKLHAPAALAPSEGATGSYWLGAWLGPKTDLETVGVATGSNINVIMLLFYVNYLWNNTSMATARTF